MPGANLAQSPEEGGVCITEALITKRNLTFPEDEDLSEKMFHTIAKLQTVRLDREGITIIRNLEGLQNLHSLYLQANKIQRIENLACIPSLRFLSLAGNRIRQVENLHDLPYLQFLDLSENLIETLKMDEFPQSLLILNLTGNRCTNQDGYRELVTGALPLLMDLDRQPVSERWISDGEDEASEEEFPELSGPFRSERGDPAFPGLQPPQSSSLWEAVAPGEVALSPHQHLGQGRTVQPGPGVSLGTQVTCPSHPLLGLLPHQDGSLLRSARGPLPQPRALPLSRAPSSTTTLALTGFLKELEQDTSRRKEHRQQAALTEHLLRMGTQPVLTELPQLPGRSIAGDGSACAPPRQGKEAPHESASLPQASSATEKLPSGFQGLPKHCPGKEGGQSS